MEINDVRYPSGGLNRDASKKVIPKEDYPYALNINRIEAGEVGTIVNSLGNEEVSFTLPAGTNKVIGFCEDEEDQAGIYFVYNSNADHCIVRYLSGTGVIEFLLDSEAVLDFDTNYINNPEVIGSGSGKLLFWPGGQRNVPRKLNLARAYIYTNPTTTTTTSTTTT